MCNPNYNLNGINRKNRVGVAKDQVSCFITFETQCFYTFTLLLRFSNSYNSIVEKNQGKRQLFLYQYIGVLIFSI